MNQSQKLLTYLVALLSASGVCNGDANVRTYHPNLKNNMLNMNGRYVNLQPKVRASEHRGYTTTPVGSIETNATKKLQQKVTQATPASGWQMNVIKGVGLPLAGFCSLAALAKYNKLGPFAEKRKDDSVLIFDEPIKIGDVFVKYSGSSGCKLAGPIDDDSSDDYAESPAPAAPFSNYVKPVFTNKNIEEFKKTFCIQKTAEKCTSSNCKILHGIKNCWGDDDNNEHFTLSYDSGYGEKDIKRVPDNFVDRVVSLIPLLGKKYTDGNTPGNQFVKNYIMNVMGEDNCITLSTVPDGPDKDKIWIVFDGNIKNSYWKKNNDKYFEDDNHKYIAVKADGKNMWANYTNCICQFDGDFKGNNSNVDGFKHLYKFYGPNSGSKVDKIEWKEIAEKSKN